jgi:hypothetical protein
LLSYLEFEELRLESGCMGRVRGHPCSSDRRREIRCSPEEKWSGEEGKIGFWRGRVRTEREKIREDGRGERKKWRMRLDRRKRWQRGVRILRVNDDDKILGMNGRVK